jgi:hypothetical protein
MKPVFIVSTTQRCGSTWVTGTIEQAIRNRMRLDGVPSKGIKLKPHYANCLQLGFSLTGKTSPSAVGALANYLAQWTSKTVHESALLLKTHDIASAHFDELCDSLPQVRFVTIRRDFKDVVISRFFYYRYFWKGAVGELPGYLKDDFQQFHTLSDAEALSSLIGMRSARVWAREWLAFDSPFTTPRALRIEYDTLLNGSGFKRLSEFCGMRVAPGRSLSLKQAEETKASGRQGNARFHRSGTSGQWRKWFSDEAAERLNHLLHELSTGSPADNRPMLKRV